jgi:hypothetical protein
LFASRVRLSHTGNYCILGYYLVPT